MSSQHGGKDGKRKGNSKDDKCNDAKKQRESESPVYAVIFENTPCLEIRSEITDTFEQAQSVIEQMLRWNIPGEFYYRCFDSKSEHDEFLEAQKAAMFIKSEAANGKATLPLNKPSDILAKEEFLDDVDVFMKTVPIVEDPTVKSPSSESRVSSDMSSSPFVQAIARNADNTGDIVKIHIFPILPTAKAGIVAWEFLNSTETHPMSWVHKPSSWTKVCQIDKDLEPHCLPFFFHQSSDFPKRDFSTGMASMIVTSKNSYQVPLLVNYGFHSTEWTKEDQVKRMIVKPLERVLLQPKVMAGYAIYVVKNIKSPKAKTRIWKKILIVLLEYIGRSNKLPSKIQSSHTTGALLNYFWTNMFRSY